VVRKIGFNLVCRVLVQKRNGKGGKELRLGSNRVFIVMGRNYCPSGEGGKRGKEERGGALDERQLLAAIVKRTLVDSLNR